MVLNIKKTVELRICTKKAPQCVKPLVASDGREIRVVEETKLLGVLESSDLKWRKHVDATVAKCSTRLYLLRMLRKTGVPRDCLVLFYNAKMRSLLSYAYPAMTNMPKFLLDKLIAVERRAYQIIGGEPQVSLVDFLGKLARGVVVAAQDRTHRLNYMFLRNERKDTVVAPKAKTTRLTNSIFKFV